jgi:hypothetical protein
MTGLDLRLLRVAQRAKSKDLAKAMGVHTSRVSMLESQAIVTDEAARRYVEALQTLTPVPPSETPAVAL